MSLALPKSGLPVSILKIDRCFVEDMPGDKEDRALVQAMLSLAASLELQVVAEGVETREKSAFLSRQGCDCAQGSTCSDVPRAQRNWPTARV